MNRLGFGASLQIVPYLFLNPTPHPSFSTLSLPFLSRDDSLLSPSFLLKPDANPLLSTTITTDENNKETAKPETTTEKHVVRKENGDLCYRHRQLQLFRSHIHFSSNLGCCSFADALRRPLCAGIRSKPESLKRNGCLNRQPWDDYNTFQACHIVMRTLNPDTC
ncbi:hypothetical protein NE237_000971 [Protea cynaroides]|uniref:Uncharacterized protein n=1 Tax=Protea cynaroides TaxID=273540 RepID=A0A9Q0QXM8_9MAGN|nr:hypothetical protein NE237_000971 [Protea cynaroides]